MNILVLAWDIPATSSMPGSPRLFNLCRYLSQRHRLSLISGCQSLERYQQFSSEPGTGNVFQSVSTLPEAPPPTWWNKQNHRLHVAPHFCNQYLRPDYYQSVLQIIHEHLAGLPPLDLIYVDTLRMTQYAETIRTVPIVVDLHDSLKLLYTRLLKQENQLFKKLPLYLEKLSVEIREQSLGKFCDLIITNSEIDTDIIKHLIPRRSRESTVTITNGVDVDYFAPLTEAQRADKLIFTGVMDYGPNADAAQYFCKEVFPVVKRTFPALEFWVVGSDPSSEIRSLASQPGVHVTGRVDDIRPYMQSATIFVCPLRVGSGMKNKILAAMAMRKPVIATPLSFEGLDVRPGKDVLVAEDAMEFVKQIGRLLNNREVAQRLGEEGFNLVRERYSWSARGQALEAALMKTVTRHVKPN